MKDELRIESGIGARGVLVAIGLVVLVVASFWSLHVDISLLGDPRALELARDFIAGFAPPDTSGRFVGRVAWATAETLAMSAIGTLLAAVFGLALALPAAGRGVPRALVRFVLAVLRAIPELVWAALFVIAAGLGPLPGTLALALHTTGVLGRLFAETIENLPAGPADALRAAGVDRLPVFCYATLPQALPQFVSYVLYRWENNIRAAAILGVVGAGGLGQMLVFHLSLFQMQRTATIVVAIVVLVAVVDGLSVALRRMLMR
jgi:phosphonate transport system permease protein